MGILLLLEGFKKKKKKNCKKFKILPILNVQISNCDKFLHSVEIAGFFTHSAFT